MKIKELLGIIEERELPLVREHDTIREVLKKMLKHPHTRLMYVVDKDGRCNGIISLGALVRHLFSSSFEPAVHARFLIPMITSETANDIMTRGLIYAIEEDEVEKVIKLMVKAAIKEIPILDGEKRIVGDITMLDLLKYYNLDQE
jgi:CBS domain-containing protein